MMNFFSVLNTYQGTDPTYNSRALGLHFDNNDEGLFLTDYSPGAKTPYASSGIVVNPDSVSPSFGTSLGINTPGPTTLTFLGAVFQFATNDFDISMFVKRSAAGAGRESLIEFGDNSGSTLAWQLWFDGSTFGFSLTDSSLIQTDITAPSPSDDVWVHVAVARSAGQLRLYTGGILRAQVANTMNIRNTPAFLTMGRNGFSGNRYIGLADEVLIYNGVAIHTGAAYAPPTQPFPNS